MTTTDIERIEQAARSVFGHEDTETSAQQSPKVMDRLRTWLHRLQPLALSAARRV